MKRLVLLAIAAAALGPAAAASPKEVATAQLSCHEGCTEVAAQATRAISDSQKSAAAIRLMMLRPPKSVALRASDQTM